MKISKKLLAALVLMGAVIGMMGCAQDSGSPYIQKYQVGDFILKDGTRLSKDETPEAGTVAAVIVREDTSTKPALGVGIVLKTYGVKWCKKKAADGTTDVKGYGTLIFALVGDKTSGCTDGSTVWDEIKSHCNDATDADASLYPAFEYSLKYADGKDFSDELKTGWYLPSIAELNTIYLNRAVVDESLGKAGGNKFKQNWFWSCCQEPTNLYNARKLVFENGNTYNQEKDSEVNGVCSVRAFN